MKTRRKGSSGRGLGVACALAALLLALLAGCAPAADRQEWQGMQPVSQMKLEYAKQFTVDFYEQGYRLITVVDDGRYLVVPENVAVPENLPPDLVVLRQPLTNLYLAATSAMDLFRSLDAVDRIRLSGTDVQGWYLPEAKQALADGTMLYAGKYSAPDYELLLSNHCDLAIESSMIYHSPEVKEQLEGLGIPVFVERSSYESSPLGRMEWIRLYGVLLGREQQAAQLFETATAAVAPLLAQPPTGKTLAFFYITSTGTVNVRKSGDYVTEMIRMAGGQALPQNLQDNGNFLSTMNMDMESFYAAAKDADILVYNSTIDGELTDMAQLLQKSSLLADFKAVKSGNVWCTGQNMFQESMGLGNMILDLHAILTQAHPQGLTYLHALQ